MKLVEIPEKQKIIEQRGFGGQLKVLGAWFLWNAAVGLGLSVALMILISSGSYLTPKNKTDVLILRLNKNVGGAILTTIIMKDRMDRKARRRWAKEHQHL